MKSGRTLSGRLFWLSSLWAVFSIALVAFLISTNYRNNSEERLIELLTANLYNLMGAVSVEENGKISGTPELRDSRFLAFRSGYYWSVTEISNPSNRIASASLADATITLPDQVALDSNFQRVFEYVDAAGNQLIGIEAQLFLGDGDDLFSFRITGNKSSVDAEVSDFVRQLLLLLTLFAAGFVLATYFLVRFGLSPLREVSQRLTDIREGRAKQLEGEFPKEIQPLVDETNSLIKSNDLVVERARTQVGNLAHSLKTPLAVLKNEAGKARPEIRKLVDEQVSHMQSHIQTYLDRARIAATTGSVIARTEVVPVVERMVRVMGKLNPDLDFALDIQKGAENMAFAGEQQDLEEMLGNLLENAAKFAKSKVIIGIDWGRPNTKTLQIFIQDDGPGMEKSQLERVFARGVRLDESKPGSGLGLSIVKDIASEYRGDISLAASKKSGLKATLILPAV